MRKRKTPWPFLYSVVDGVIHQNRTVKVKRVGCLDTFDAPY